ncbi:hypothetical protein ANN_02491 [Periplaneta americana]|uniref:Uncharacterized protein n=1 Tax=Periplaneta americana TaxID=6978 RepID=A0ABQ8TZW7_PERAM|nr:hypothetical protein ANN_02491 [Periplaneta americana]
MSPGSSTESYPAFAHIGLRENPGKNLNQVTCPDRDSNPGHLVSQPDALTVTPQDLERNLSCGGSILLEPYLVNLQRIESWCQKIVDHKRVPLRVHCQSSTILLKKSLHLLMDCKPYFLQCLGQHRTDSMVSDVAKGLTIGAEAKDMGKSFNLAETALTADQELKNSIKVHCTLYFQVKSTLATFFVSLLDHSDNCLKQAGEFACVRQKEGTLRHYARKGEGKLRDTDFGGQWAVRGEGGKEAVRNRLFWKLRKATQADCVEATRCSTF